MHTFCVESHFVWSVLLSRREILFQEKSCLSQRPRLGFFSSIARWPASFLEVTGSLVLFTSSRNRRRKGEESKGGGLLMRAKKKRKEEAGANKLTLILKRPSHKVSVGTSLSDLIMASLSDMEASLSTFRSTVRFKIWQKLQL